MKYSNVIVIAVSIFLFWRFLIDPAPLIAVGLFAGSTIAFALFNQKHPDSKFRFWFFFILYFGFWGTIVYKVIHYIIITWK